MGLKFRHDGVRQNGEAVVLAFAGADDDLMVAEVNVLYPQAQTFHETQPAAIQDFGHQAGSAAHFINDRHGFDMGQNSGQDLRAGGAHQYGGQVDLFLPKAYSARRCDIGRGWR